MKKCLLASFFGLMLCGGAAAQNPSIPPFYQVYGGLFYPAEENHRATYGSPSDFVWGMGMGLPVSADFFYIISDISWFRTRVVTPSVPDTTTELSQNFIHLGLMNKYFMAKSLTFRFQGGLNYNAIGRKITPAGGTEIKNELPRKFGFFGGVGLENIMAGGKMAVFADLVYDYRRSAEKDLYGDFGGLRIVGGVTLYWF
ncbi:MAG TPA: hypothetical protein VJO14_02385 [Bacteroidota bacterium]|nr:hypothetical protein [Bacteroidota bacterium]